MVNFNVLLRNQLFDASNIYKIRVATLFYVKGDCYGYH